MVKSKDGVDTFQHYLVVFIDLLGQREALRAIKYLPVNEQEREKFTSQIKETLGKVIEARKMFSDFFEGTNVHVPDINRVPLECRDDFIASSKLNLDFSGFSDSIIITVPFGGGDEHCTAMNGVYHALIATGGLGLYALARKIPLRAGLDVGIGTMVDDGIYGPALERAYYLESQLAEYPRFLIGDELEKFLLLVSEQNSKTKLGEVAKSLAKRCRELIVRDSDGRLMLDFLGSGFKDIFDNPIDISVVDLALDFVSSQYEKFSEEKNHKLSSRYYRLMKYIEERKGLWVSP